MGWRRQTVLIMTTAFVVRLGYVVAIGRLTCDTPDIYEQIRIARYLAHGTGFVSPVGPERHDPSSWYVPGYIAWMAAVFRLLGEHSPAALSVIRLLNIAAQAAAVGIWTAVGRYLLGRRVAALGAVLMVGTFAITYKADEIWDTFPTMLVGALGMAIFVFRRLDRCVTQFAAGLYCGAAAMLNPCFTLCYPLWFIWNARRKRALSERPGKVVSHLACLPVGFVLVITPWTIRNRVVFGHWFYLRSNLGLELWRGNAPWSDGMGFTEDGRQVHPMVDQTEADRLVARGEYGYFQDRLAEARQWFRSEPGRVARLTLRRVAWFWLGRHDLEFGTAYRVLKFVSFALSGALGVAGAFWILIRRPGVWILPAMVLVFPLPYYLTIVMVRYRLPIEPLILLLSSVAVVRLLSSNHAKRRGMIQRHPTGRVGGEVADGG
jgi:hypothetical protein